MLCLVESRIQRERPRSFWVRRSRPIRGVVGVKVFADHIWQKVQSGEYQSFSIEGRGYVSQEFDLSLMEINSLDEAGLQCSERGQA